MQSPFHNFLIATLHSYFSALGSLEDFASCAVPPLKLSFLPSPFSRIITMYRTAQLLFSSRSFRKFRTFYFLFPPNPSPLLLTVMPCSVFAKCLQAETALQQLDNVGEHVWMRDSYIGAIENNKSSCGPTSSRATLGS